jgi:DNA-binding GntR family transcriptional regulator
MTLQLDRSSFNALSFGDVVDIFEKLPTRTLRTRIAERMRAAMLSGKLRPGDRLVERKLAAQFGASLTAVREALISLETDGLVIKTPNAATYVTKLSLEDIRKIFALRAILEPFAVQEATRVASDGQLLELENIYFEMVDAARKDDRQEYIKNDSRWHESIWEITGNQYLQTALKRLVLPAFGYTSMRFVSGSSFDLISDAHSHFPVMQAIKSRDPDAAGKGALAACNIWRDRLDDYVRSQNNE